MLKTEFKRQILHIGMIFFALLLRFLTKWQAVSLAIIALLFNLFIVPRIWIKHQVYREHEHKGKYSSGFVAYPLSMVILTLFFSLGIASISLGVMGVGDGFSSIFGRLWGKKKILWNKSKSYVGSFAFFVFSFFVTLMLLFWNGFSFPIESYLMIGIVISLFGAIIESLPLKIDDNISVPIFVAIVLYFLIRFI